MKGAKASDYHRHSFSSDGKLFYYQKTANSHRTTVKLCACGKHCTEPYNAVCKRASVTHLDQICANCAKIELDAKFSLNEGGQTVVSFIDPTSSESGRITIKLTEHFASINPKIPGKYRSMLGDIKLAQKVHDEVLAKAKLEKESSRSRGLYCCYEGCNTHLNIPNCYCTRHAHVVRSAYVDSENKVTIYESRDGSDLYEYPWDSRRRVPLECHIGLHIEEYSEKYNATLERLRRMYNVTSNNRAQARSISRKYIAKKRAEQIAAAMSYKPAPNLTVFDALFRRPALTIGTSDDFRETQGNPYANLYHASIRLDEYLQRDGNGDLLMLPSAQLSEESFDALHHGSTTHTSTYAGADITLLGSFVQRHWRAQVTDAIRRSGDGSITVDLLVMFPTNPYYWMFNQVVMDHGVVSPRHANLCKCAGPFAPDMIIRHVFKKGDIDFQDFSANVERTLLYAGGKTKLKDRLDWSWEKVEANLVVDGSGMGVFPRDSYNPEAIESLRVNHLQVEDSAEATEAERVEPLRVEENEIVQARVGISRHAQPSTSLGSSSVIGSPSTTMTAALFCSKVRDLKDDFSDSNFSEESAIVLLQELGSTALQPEAALAILNGRGNALSTLALIRNDSESGKVENLAEQIVSSIVDRANSCLPTADSYSLVGVLRREKIAILKEELATLRQELRKKEEVLLLKQHLRDVTSQPSPPPTKRIKLDSSGREVFKIQFDSGGSRLSFMAHICSTSSIPPEIGDIKSKLHISKQKSLKQFLQIIKSRRSNVSYIMLNRDSNDKDAMKRFFTKYNEIPYLSIQKHVWVFILSPFCLKSLRLDGMNVEKMHFAIVRQ